MGIGVGWVSVDEENSAAWEKALGMTKQSFLAGLYQITIALQ
jgi:hypothetical protein